MKFIFAVLAFAVAVVAQEAPAYQYFDNECTRTQPVGSLCNLVGKVWTIYNMSDKINCSTVQYSVNNGVTTAVYGSLSPQLQGKYGDAATFIENPNRPGETEVFLNGTIVAIQVLIVVKPGVGYKNAVCDPENDTEINLIGVYGEANISEENLNKLVRERRDVAPQLKLKPVPLVC